MLERLFHLLSGCAEFEVRGDAARFFNMVSKSGLGLWGFRKDGGVSVASVKAREYKKLRPLCRRCGVVLALRNKRGLPFQTARLLKRKGLLAGICGGALLYGFLSSFLWGVSVSGTETLTDYQVLKTAEQCGVYVGASLREFNPRRASHGIADALEELSWVTVNTNGCFAEIVVKEREKKPEVADDKSWSNIVASQAGRVVEIRAERGRPEVDLGDTVQQGELLISGLYQEKIDPYGIQPEHPLETAGAARGSVIAETYREFTVQVGAVKKEKKPDGRKKVNRAFTLLGIRIPLGLNTVPEGDYRFYSRTIPLKLLGVELPVTFEENVYEFLQEERRSLTEKERKEAALLKLRDAQKTALPQGKIIEEKLEYSFADGLCLLQARCRCREEIGEIRKILVKS